MEKQPKKDIVINKEVEQVKAKLEGETMNDIFQLNNKQTFSSEVKPKNNKGLALWGTKH